MARPRKDGLDYFPHDVNPTDEEEIFENEFGADGYRFYYKIQCRIFACPNAELKVGNSHTRILLAKKIAPDLETFNKMLMLAFEIGFLDRQIYETKQILTSEKLKKILAFATKDRERMRETRRASSEFVPNKSEQTLNSSEINTNSSEFPLLSFSLDTSSNEVSSKEGGIQGGEQTAVSEPTPEPKTQKQKFGANENVELTEKDLESLKTKFGDDLDECIEFLDEYYEDNPKRKRKDRSDKAQIKRWVYGAVLTRRANNAQNQQKIKRANEYTMPHKGTSGTSPVEYKSTMERQNDDTLKLMKEAAKKIHERNGEQGDDYIDIGSGISPVRKGTTH